MKKYLAIIVSVMLCATMFITADAASMAKDLSGVTFETKVSDEFDGSEINADVWMTEVGTPVVADGKLVLGSGDWIATGAYVGSKAAYTNCKITFDICGDKRDCYYGFGFRIPEGTSGSLYNGGRNDIPNAAELGYGITVDIFSKGTDCEGYFVISFNDGAQGDSPNFKIAYPSGYDAGVAAKFQIVDFGDTATIYLADAELCTLVFSGLDIDAYKAVKAYDASGAELASLTVNVPVSGSFGFYQRNNAVYVGSVLVETEKGSSPATSDAAVVVIAAVAAIALAGVVVCKKVKA